MSEQSNRPVGITKGPGETIHEYTFISRDEQRLLKNGEYVYYVLDEPDNAHLSANGSGPRTRQPRRVLGRIQQREAVQLYPDTFLSEPEVSPSQVAALVGYDQRANDLPAHGTGFRDPRPGSFSAQESASASRASFTSLSATSL